ncbi:MAG: hypothetical protein QG626_728 [Patescibacteria group bacterium]|jgi:hypothetical protein|nr:hypothetical protein [Patescibacteria group bacterium]
MFFFLDSHFDPLPDDEDAEHESDPDADSDFDFGFGDIDDETEPVELCEYVEFSLESETDMDEGLEQNLFPSAGNPIEPRRVDIAALVSQIERHERSLRVGGPSYWDIVPGDDDRPLKPRRVKHQDLTHGQLLARSLAEFDAEEADMLEAGSRGFPDDDN